uniref:Uncharacterized protein n=1 Tax=Oryza brachyantha TaxID=4533 RepID=J3L8H0_ORYBR
HLAVLRKPLVLLQISMVQKRLKLHVVVLGWLSRLLGLLCLCGSVRMLVKVES